LRTESKVDHTRHETCIEGKAESWLLNDLSGGWRRIHGGGMLRRHDGGGEEGSSTVAGLTWQLSLYDKAFLMDLKSFVIGVMKKTAGRNDLSM
jgi:hypothetical protein